MKTMFSKARTLRMPLALSVLVALTFLTTFLPAGVADASPGTTTRVSVNSEDPVISPDGRFVVFTSYAPNLVPGDTNGSSDIFVRDLENGVTERVSLASDGTQANAGSFNPIISSDGRFVAFESLATNLVVGDTNGRNDVFVHDRQTSMTSRVSVDSAGNQALSAVPTNTIWSDQTVSISGDGRYVAFQSDATNLAVGDTNTCSYYTEPGRCPDIFVHDRQTGITSRVSVDSAGNQGNGWSLFPSFSLDGHYVAFSSESSNLVAGDTNGVNDTFVHDMQTGLTVRVSLDTAGNQVPFPRSESVGISANGRFVSFVSGQVLVRDRDTDVDGIFDEPGAVSITPASVDSAGAAGNSYSYLPAISFDGRYVGFQSSASNLVADDTNGIPDVFVHDRQTGSTTRVSVASDGSQRNGENYIFSQYAYVSSTGRRVVFLSDASNLVPNDTIGSIDVFMHDLGDTFDPCADNLNCGYYHPVTPYRVLDTRAGPQGVPAGKVGGNAEITVDVTGGPSGVPDANVSAVVVNVTVTEPMAGSYLTVYPSGESRPLSSNLNFGPGQTVPNLVTVKVGADGKVKVYNAVGQTHVILDVVGWYGEPTGGSRFNAVTPARILDTRNATGGLPGKVGQGGTISVGVKGVGGVPPTPDVSAVVLNTTVTEPTTGGYLTVYPSDVALPPTASNLNFGPGQTVPNLVIVKVGADGKVKVSNCCGQTHVVFDVVGWYSSATGDQFHPLTPSRVLDTRSSPQGMPPGRVGQAASITVPVAGMGGVPQPESGVRAAVVNTTVTEPTADSYLTVYPPEFQFVPLASNLNFAAGQTIPNLVMMTVGKLNGKVKVYNAVGQTHVIFDVVGYFGP